MIPLEPPALSIFSGLPSFVRRATNSLATNSQADQDTSGRIGFNHPIVPKVSVQPSGERHIIVTPQEEAIEHSVQGLHISVSRVAKPLSARISRAAQGVYTVELDRKEACGILNVTARPEPSTDWSQTVLLDYGECPEPQQADHSWVDEIINRTSSKIRSFSAVADTDANIIQEFILSEIKLAALQANSCSKAIKSAAARGHRRWGRLSGTFKRGLRHASPAIRIHGKAATHRALKTAAKTAQFTYGNTNVAGKKLFRRTYRNAQGVWGRITRNRVKKSSGMPTSSKSGYGNIRCSGRKAWKAKAQWCGRAKKG
jgi:hypothetical protein